MKTVSDFIFWDSKITADGDCSHEIKRRLLLGRKVITNLDSILKSRDITLPTKICLVKAMVFPMVMYGCESWTVKKAERRRIDAFEVWCWRRLLRVPGTARRSNQFILKEISPGISLEGMIVKMIKNFENKMEKMQDSINKDLEELKNKHTQRNNKITEIKNTLERINSRISEAEEQISESEDKWWGKLLKSRIK